MQTLAGITGNAGNDEYRVARLSKGNVRDLAKLHFEVYGLALTEEYFLRKYDTSNTGLQNAGFIAYTIDGKPVAFFGIIPCFMNYKDEKTFVGQAVDAITHPEYMGKGLFKALSKMTCELCISSGIKLFFGFPNQNSFPPMVNELGWVQVQKMDMFSIPVNKVPRFRLFKNRKKQQQKVLDQLATSRKWLPNSMINEGFAGIYRDEAYHRYKSFTNSYLVKMDSAEMWINLKKELIIGDIHLTGINEDLFFDEIKDLARQLGTSKITFHVCNGCKLYDLFAFHCNPLPSFPVIMKDAGSGLPFEKIKFTFADIDIF